MRSAAAGLLVLAGIVVIGWALYLVHPVLALIWAGAWLIVWGIAAHEGAA